MAGYPRDKVEHLAGRLLDGNLRNKVEHLAERLADSYLCNKVERLAEWLADSYLCNKAEHLAERWLDRKASINQWMVYHKQAVGEEPSEEHFFSGYSHVKKRI